MDRERRGMTGIREIMVNYFDRKTVTTHKGMKGA
jgi:hypothetical protein